MNIFQEFKNQLIISDELIMLVDDGNENLTFGYSENLIKINYNIKQLEQELTISGFFQNLKICKSSTTVLFPLGRYITILEAKKDMSCMRLYFFDFSIDYESARVALKGFGLSDNLAIDFQRLKYEMDEAFTDDLNKVSLSLDLEP